MTEQGPNGVPPAVRKISYRAEISDPAGGLPMIVETEDPDELERLIDVASGPGVDTYAR